MALINRYIVRPTATFKEELRDIIKYIKLNLREPLIAQKFYDEVIEKISSLKFMPERYTKIDVSNNRSKNLRKLPVKDYLIIYEVDKNTRTSFYFTYFSLYSKLF